MYLKIILLVLVADSTVWGISAGDNNDQNNGRDRALGYRKKGKGAVAPKPTWRPWKSSDYENSPLSENKLDTDGFFPDDYYDTYDSEVEGTRRNILVHHTFEERMKTYVKIMREAAKNSALINGEVDKLSDAAKKVKPKGKTAKNGRKSVKTQRTAAKPKDDDDEEGGLLGIL